MNSAYRECHHNRVNNSSISVVHKNLSFAIMNIKNVGAKLSITLANVKVSNYNRVCKVCQLHLILSIAIVPQKPL